MRQLAVILSLFQLAVVSRADDQTDRLYFKETGYSIKALEERTAGTAQSVMMFLPATDEFAPNVNVQIQPYSGTIGEYMELSKGQFKDAKITLLGEKTIAKNAVQFEYTGPMQGRQLHWYARAESNGSKVYLVTATATETQWAKQGGKLKECVESFRLETAVPK